MPDSNAQKLQRIEDKIDCLTVGLNDLTTHAAVIENRTKDLEERRKESYERQNKFSEKLDHVHDCMHDVKAKTELSHKLIWGVGIAILIGIANEIMTII